MHNTHAHPHTHTLTTHTYAHTCAHAHMHAIVYAHACIRAYTYRCTLLTYGVAAISRLLQIIGLFCKRALYKR